MFKVFINGLYWGSMVNACVQSGEEVLVGGGGGVFLSSAGRMGFSRSGFQLTQGCSLLPPCAVKMQSC